VDPAFPFIGFKRLNDPVFLDLIAIAIGYVFELDRPRDLIGCDDLAVAVNESGISAMADETVYRGAVCDFGTFQEYPHIQ